MKKVYILGAMACLFTACKPSVTINNPVSAGNAVFTNYMAVGNSLTSGYSNNSLYVTGQLNSYPQRLFEQFSLVAGNKGAKGPFIQPLMATDNGYPSAKLVLDTLLDTCAGTYSLGPISLPGFVKSTADSMPYVSPANNGQINNIGVPGIRIADYDVSNYAALNPYAARFYHNTLGTPMDELAWTVHNLYPTFFTFWLGANDVLGYATAGGQGNGNGTAVPVAGNIYNTSDITPISVFESLYDSALNVAMSNGASGALINIPDVTSVPFFNTVPANGLYLTRQGQADSLNALWQVQFPNILFHIGYNYFIIKDNNNQTRQAVPGELILLTTPLYKLDCYGWGSTTPIPCQYVLTTDELQNIRNATKTFNDYIYQESIKYHLAYVDMFTYLGTIASGISYNGINYTASYVSGGAFSLDGVHLTQRGYALVANEILTTINSYYHSTIPLTDVNKYQGIQFP